MTLEDDYKQTNKSSQFLFKIRTEIEHKVSGVLFYPLLISSYSYFQGSHLNPTSETFSLMLRICFLL